MSSDLPREKLSSLVASFMSYSAGHLPDDVKLRLTEMSKIENEGFAPEIYNVMKKNMELADSLKRPSCQDTGIPQFFARVGSKWPYMDIVEDALIDAVREATAKAPLRPNAVEVFDEKNTGNNIGTHSPWIDWEIVKDSDQLELYFYMAGGGCSQMTTYGVNACPPCLVGIGIAGSSEVAAKLSKKALLRQVGSHNPNPKAAEMEKLLEDGLNSIGLGPGGFGGKLSVMGVNIEQASRHPATLAMGMSTACWAHRRAGIRINPDFTYDFFTHKGVVL